MTSKLEELAEQWVNKKLGKIGYEANGEIWLPALCHEHKIDQHRESYLAGAKAVLEFAKENQMEAIESTGFRREGIVYISKLETFIEGEKK